MKQIQVFKPYQISIIEVQAHNNIEGNKVRVQIKAAGICGSDIHVYEGMNPMAQYPVVLGHEAAGVVIEVGAAVTNCQVGDHVVLEPLSACGQCYACKKGRPNACAFMKARGCHIDGFFSEEITIDSQSVFPISRNISWKDAAMTEPYTIAAQAAFRSRAEAGDSILIFGAGTMGITMLDVFNLLNCHCAIVDIDPKRLEIARRHGVAESFLSDRGNSWQKEFREKYRDSPPNIVIEATGIPAFLTLAVELVSSAGRIINLGFSQTQAPISPLELTKKEVDLLGSRHQTFQFSRVIDWINSKQIIPGNIVDHVANFQEAIQIFSEIHVAHKQSRNPGKFLLMWN